MLLILFQISTWIQVSRTVDWNKVCVGEICRTTHKSVWGGNYCFNNWSDLKCYISNRIIFKQKTEFQFSHLSPEMHVTGTLGTSCYTQLIKILWFPCVFVFDRIACFMVRIRARRHFVMPIIKSMNIISVHFWTYLNYLGHPWNSDNVAF